MVCPASLLDNAIACGFGANKSRLDVACDFQLGPWQGTGLLAWQTALSSCRALAGRPGFAYPARRGCRLWFLSSWHLPIG